MLTLPAELTTAPWKTRGGKTSPTRLITLFLLLLPAVLLSHEFITRMSAGRFVYWSGVWATVVLLASLAVTPARRIYGFKWIMGLRRMIGVAALAYTMVHLFAYFWLRLFDFSVIIDETFTRVAIAVGTLSTLGLLALGTTSFDTAIRAMGSRNWNWLHKSVYLFTALGLYHYLVFYTIRPGLLYFFVGAFAWLILWRIANRFRLGDSIPFLFGLAAFTTVFTVFFEACWPLFILGGNPMITLRSNLTLEFGLTGGWMTALTAFAIAMAAWIKQTVSQRSREIRHGVS